jgi:hypothetical protein
MKSVNKKSEMGAQSGQVLIEAILMISLLAGISMALTRALRNYELPKKIALDPWARLDGMIQCGVWQPCGSSSPTKFTLHANNYVLSLDTKTEP